MQPRGEPVVDNTSEWLNRAWHAVALSGEVGPKPSRIWLLGQPWCLARRPDGTPAAWADRCPHRLAPLSCGRMVGENIECGYHGWTFSLDGRCLDIPAIDQAPPPRARVGVPWAVQERYGVIWMAPEPPASTLFRFEEWDDPAFDTGQSEVVRTRAGAALLVDNFLDAAHFPYVHSASFGVEEAARVVDRGVRRREQEVETVFETWYREGGSTQRHLLTKTGQASLTVRLRLEFPDTGLAIGIIFSCTPELAGTTRVYKLLARNDIGGDPDRMKRFIAEEDQILREDLAILEHYDHEWVPLGRTVEVHTRADRLSLAWRELMRGLSGS